MTSKSPWSRTKPWHFTPEEILENPDKIYRMLPCDIQAFESKYLPPRSRKPRLRELINTRKKQLRTIEREYSKTLKNQQLNEQREIKLEEKVSQNMARIRQLHIYVIGAVESLQYPIDDSRNDEDIAAITRNIGNMIYDLPPVYTGLMSYSQWRSLQLGANVDSVFEHFYPRSIVAGDDIFRLAYELISSGKEFRIRDMINAAYSCCQGNKTTKKENNITLPPFQKRETFVTPPQSYLDAGITLVRERPFVIPDVWDRIACNHGVVLIPPPEFANVISRAEAARELLAEHDVDIQSLTQLDD